MPKYVLALLYYACAATNLLFMIKTLRQKTAVAKQLGIAMFFSCCTALSYALYLSFDNYFLGSLFHSLEFVSIDFILIFLVRYAFAFIGGHKYSKSCSATLFFIAGADALLLLTNPWHELALSYNQSLINGSYYFEYIKKLPFHIHLVFSYAMLVLFISIFVYQCFRVPYVYARKYYVILSCILTLVLMNAIFLFVAGAKGPDISILFYAFYGIVLYFLSFRYHSHMLTRQMRSMVFNYMTTPLVLFDNEDVLADMNDFSGNILPLNAEAKNSLTLAGFLELLKLTDFQIAGELESSTELTLPHGARTLYFRVNYKLLRDERDRILGKLFVFHDITRQMEMYQTLEQLANVDSLTGLYNKHHFDNSLLEFDKEENYPLSVVVFDIDALKTINSIFGDSMGDHVIWHVATSIRALCPKNAQLFRLEGDETVVLLPNTPEPQALELARQLVGGIEHGHSFEFELTLEFGVACKRNSSMADLPHILSLARNNMVCKKMLNRRSVKSALVDSLMKTLSQSDFETEEHCERVKLLCHEVGTKMQLSDLELSSLELLAILHDIGKLSIPSNILRKPSALTDAEWELMKQHTVKGFHIANTSQELSGISNLILCHHERWDGKGYPNALTGKEIPLLSRILTVVDSFDVMTHDRPYHSAISVEDALAELERCSGTQFDPEVVRVIRELKLDKSAPHA